MTRSGGLHFWQVVVPSFTLWRWRSNDPRLSEVDPRAINNRMKQWVWENVISLLLRFQSTIPAPNIIAGFPVCEGTALLSKRIMAKHGSSNNGNQNTHRCWTTVCNDIDGLYSPSVVELSGQSLLAWTSRVFLIRANSKTAIINTFLRDVFTT